MDITTIITFVTFVVTYIFGELAKKFNWIEKSYIPVQNLVIGVLVSICYYIFVDNSSIQNAVVVAIGALSAGGVYDLVNIKKEK